MVCITLPLLSVYFLVKELLSKLIPYVIKILYWDLENEDNFSLNILKQSSRTADRNCTNPEWWFWEAGTAYPSWASGFTPFSGAFGLFICLAFCVVVFCVLFVYVLCLVCQMLPFSLYCPFSNVYLFRTFEALIYSLATIECKQRREHASHIVSVEWFHQSTVSPSVINLAFLAGDRFMRLSHSLSASANVLLDRSVSVLLCVGNFMM